MLYIFILAASQAREDAGKRFHLKIKKGTRKCPTVYKLLLFTIFSYSFLHLPPVRNNLTTTRIAGKKVHEKNGSTCF